MCNAFHELFIRRAPQTFFENNAENKPDLRNLKFQNRKTSEWGNPLSKSTGS